MTMALPTAVDDDGEYHDLLRQAGEMRARAFDRRRDKVLALHREGHRPPKIALELEREARDAGCSEVEIERLGISVHNVRRILRQAGLLP